MRVSFDVVSDLCSTDTWDAFEDAFRELEAEGILPPLNKLKEEKSLA